jgi:small GTP-binding protein
LIVGDHAVTETKTDRKVALAAVLDEIFEICGNAPLERLQPAICDLKQRLKTDEVRLAVLGQMKRGKSSLLNALLGEPILPTGVLPLTSVVTEIRYAADPRACIVYRSGLSEEIALADIGEYVTEALNPGNRKGVEALQLFYPSNLLRKGLVLVDTPGFGSTHSHNTVTTLGYLGKVDAAIIVFSVDPPITEVEASFIREIRKDIPRLLFVLNKTDLVTTEEVNAAREFLHDELTNKVQLSSCEIFPLSARFRASELANEHGASGLSRFADYLRDFARYRHDETLFFSILSHVSQVLDLASFALCLSTRFSSLESSELRKRRAEMRVLVDQSARETDAIGTLLRQEQAAMMAEVIEDLDAHVRSSTPYLEQQLAELRRANPNASGRPLGKLLENFFNVEAGKIFRDWRMQEDARLSSKLKEIEGRYAEKANSILMHLAEALASMVDVPAAELKVNSGLAMDSKVTYSVQPIFYSLDRFLLAIPPPIQRNIVYRRVRNSIAGRLDRNAGRIRFDYLERLERSFKMLEQTLKSQIQDTEHALTGALEAPSTDGNLLAKVRAVQAYVSLLKQ